MEVFQTRSELAALAGAVGIKPSTPTDQEGDVAGSAVYERFKNLSGNGFSLRSIRARQFSHTLSVALTFICMGYPWYKLLTHGLFSVQAGPFAPGILALCTLLLFFAFATLVFSGLQLDRRFRPLALMPELWGRQQLLAREVPGAAAVVAHAKARRRPLFRLDLDEMERRAALAGFRTDAYE